jgi:hypothetical protein
MADIFNQMTILPSYAAGFIFIWDISDGFDDPLPWEFVVEEAPTSEGPWEPISPTLTNIRSFADTVKRVPGKDLVLMYRVKLVTPKDTYYSFPKHPYGDLNRREQLIVRDIMRREVLQQDDMAGVRIKLWVRATNGPKCTTCLDPITGGVAVTNCKECMGVGFNPPYHGPYEVWGTFSPTRKNTELKPDGTGLQQVYSWQVRLIGFPFIKDRDIIVDIKSDKRYSVDGIEHLTEIRRIPVVQQVRVLELPTSDPIYRLDTPVEGEEGCVLP